MTTFDKLRGTSPFSSVTFALPEASRRFRASPSDAGPQRALRCFVIFGEPSGRCFVIFGEPSGILRVTPPSRGGDCLTIARLNCQARAKPLPLGCHDIIPRVLPMFHNVVKENGSFYVLRSDHSPASKVGSFCFRSTSSMFEPKY